MKREEERGTENETLRDTRYAYIMRVYELAKELETTSKELIAELHKYGFDVKNHMSSVEVDAVQKIRDGAAKTQNAPTRGAALRPGERGTRETVSVKQDTLEVKGTQAATSTQRKVEPSDHSPQGGDVKVRDQQDTLHASQDTLEPKAETISSPIEEPNDKPSEKVITFRGAIIVRELAGKISVKPNQLIAELMMMNVLASINERIDLNIAQQIAGKHGFILEHEKRAVEQKPAVKKTDEEDPEEDLPKDLEPRPPVVTFLGHIDHGKTSLLDRIRNSAITKKEHGGITQHIGAYTIEKDRGKITFLDTPGHAAFTAMRARGANLTDIAVIVIAADDGIMPQTKEAIKHAQAAKTTILVAINKIDLKTADTENVMRQLQSIDLTPEEWGGKTICCMVSAVTGEGIDHLLEMILLQAEILELKANPKCRAQGYVIEAQMESGMGPIANLLITRGTLHVGDIIVCEHYHGRTKALINDHGIKIRTALPSMPVKCMGLSGVPRAGEKFKVYMNDKIARNLAEARHGDLKEQQLVIPKKVSLENLFDQIKTKDSLELRLVLKCDTQGSLEAIQHALKEIKSEKISMSIILPGVGNININDVLLASASNALIIGFNVSKENGVLKVEKQEGVEIRLYSIIYQILDQIKEAMLGMLAPEMREKSIGKAEIRQVFAITKKGKVAGCLVISGNINSKCKVRVKRNNDVLYEGSIVTLKRFQNDASEVREGQECGIRLSNFSEFDLGDILEFFEMEAIAQQL